MRVVELSHLGQENLVRRAQDMKCVVCGSTSLIGGALQSEDASKIGFQPDDAPAFKRAMALGRRRVRAYGCVHCQHLQLAVEFTEEDIERYQQFEGRQPGVLERINGGAPQGED